MSLLRTFEKRDISAQDPALRAVWESWALQDATGMRINHQNVFGISAFYSAVSIIAETVASLPCIIYRRLDERNKERAPTHPLYRLLHDQPNDLMTAMEFFEAQQAYILTWGNAFAQIERDGSGEVAALWPMAPDRMRIRSVNGRLWYFYRPPDNTAEITLASDDVLHVRGIGDGIVGYSPVDLFRQTLGLCKAEEEYRARFFANDARPGAVVEYPGILSDTAYARYKEDWQQKYSGLGNKFRVAFLEQGLKWHDVGFPPETAEFIEGRKFQVEEVARIFRVPLILLQSTEKATSWGTGIEQFLLAFALFTIRPWLVRWEKRISASLLIGALERRRYFAEFLYEAILRADIKTRQEAYRIAIEGGWMTRNEARAAENMNPAAGLDRFLVQQNLAQVDENGDIIPINKPELQSTDLIMPVNGTNGAAGD